jgi:hypothetical protein
MLKKLVSKNILSILIIYSDNTKYGLMLNMVLGLGSPEIQH